MIYAASTWFAYVLIFASFGLLFYRRTAAVIGLVAATVVSLPAALAPLGNCAPWRPSPGEYTVLGAKIEVDVAITALLDSGVGEPRCYRLPYSTMKANDLQAALDGEGGATAKIKGGEGGEYYEGEPPVSEDAAKQAEAPAMRVPG